jgi:uridine kinase
LRGDVINIVAYHYDAAKKIVEKILQQIKEEGGIFSISVAGESGSGKSEMAKALEDELKKFSVSSVILQQDDYFFLPPKSNDKKRRKDFNWIGPQEVKLDLISDHIQQIKAGEKSISKPLVLYNDDMITEEAISIGDSKVVIVEGTYTSLLKNIDHKIFIARTKNDTLESREKRSRAAHELDEFTDKVLEKEHKIISEHKSLANTIISRTYEVEFVS